MESDKKTHVSIVVIGHHEGRLLYRTLRSVKMCQAYASKNGVNTELILVLNSADSETLSVAYQWKETWKLDQLIYTHFPIPGPARNAGVNQAQGDYVIFCDGDDLYSENWVYSAFVNVRLEGPKAIIHPEYTVCFGLINFFQRLTNQQSPKCDLRDLLFLHFWSSALIVSREIFQTLYFLGLEPGKGLGPEDWHLNCEAISLGYTHNVAAGTVRFYRQKKDSLGLYFVEEKAVIPTSKFFEDKRIFSYSHHPEETSLVENAAAAQLPTWVIEEAKNMAAIEPDLFPTVSFIASQKENILPQKSEELKNLYGWLIRQWPETEKCTHLFMLPAVSTGGLTIEALAFIEALYYKLNQRPIIITTDKGRESDWLNKLPRDIRVVDLGSKLFSIPEDEIVLVLLRLLIQRQPLVVQVIGSWVGWRLLAEYGLALSQYSRLYGMDFSDWLDNYNQPQGFFRNYLDRSYPYLTGVLTDNKTFCQLYTKLLGLSPNVVRTVYAPIDADLKNQRRFQTDELLRSKQILWAGRLDKQKRPDILATIAENLHDYTFWVYGRSVLDSDLLAIERLKRLPNVRFMGAYENFAELLIRPYSLFLYTSHMDGLPNVLLEATMAGLPVVAPDVGGVKEIINQERGFLIPDCQDIKEYCRVIRSIGVYPEETRSRLERAIKMVESRHSQENFLQTLKDIPGYLEI